MVSIFITTQAVTGQYDSYVHDVRCLSTDTKPTTGIKNGSTCTEMDTGKIYLYDEENQLWREL